MEKRRLGGTDARLSVIGFGGLVVRDLTASEASRAVAAAVDKGINYFDVAPSYGNAEERLGPALAPYRSTVFLACKTGERTATAAMAELHRSLKRLQTDHFDLYQLHGVTTLAEVDQILGPHGALEAFREARDQGLIRYLGFSAHAEDAARRLLDAFQFDSMLFPVNGPCWTKGNFGPAAMEAARRKGTGILALKSLAKRAWREGEARKWPKCWYAPVETLPEAKAALAFTLSKPVTAAVSPGHAELLWLMCDALEELGPGFSAAAAPGPGGEPIFTSGK